MQMTFMRFLNLNKRIMTEKSFKKQNENKTLEDIKEGVSILEKLTNVFVTIFSIFKPNKKQ